MKHLRYLKICSSSKKRRGSVLSLTRTFVLFALLTTLTSDLRAGESLAPVYEFINSGETGEARDFLMEHPWAGVGYEWEVLNLWTTLNGSQIIAFGSELLNCKMDRELRCALLVLVANACLSEKQSSRALDMINRYGGSCTNAEGYPALALVKARANHALGKGSKSVAELRKLLKQPRSWRHSEAIALMIGEIYLQQGRPESAAPYYSRVAQVSESQNRVLALTKLENLYRTEGQFNAADQVLRQLGRNCEAYCRLYRNDALTLADATSARVNLAMNPVDSRSGKLYAVRVGSFDDESEAKQMKEKFSSQGYTARLVRDENAGHTRFAVDIGRFDNAERAARFMMKLQRLNQDTYFVITL